MGAYPTNHFPLPDTPPVTEETPGQHCARWLKSAKAKAQESNTVLSWAEVGKIIDATLAGLSYFKQVVPPTPKAPQRHVKAFSSEFGDRKAIPPSPEQVSAYAASRGIRLEGQEFCDHYDSNGWKVGKTSMKDWQAAVRTWGHDKRRKITTTSTARDYSKI